MTTATFLLKSHPRRYRMSHIPRTISAFLLLTFCLLLFLPACAPAPTPDPTSTIILTNTPTHLPPTIEIPTQTPYVITATPETIAPTSVPQGVFFLSLEEGSYYHLYAFSPQTLQLTRLTTDSWDDITPALSPNGNWLAYSSRRNGYWDLYLLDLVGGGILRMTDTPEYDAAPSWSPDGAFIAFESYVNGNLEIFLLAVTDPGQAPIQLTQNPATDTSPAWSPLSGRQIAFISNRTGEPEVWIADLDHAGNFINVSNNPQTVEAHPAWSPDGSKLAWASTDPDSGLTCLYVWDTRTPIAPARWAGSGDWPVWQNNDNVASRLPTPNQTYLTGYTIAGAISIPPMLLPGALDGFSYGTTSAELPGLFQAVAQVTPPASYGAGTNSQSNPPSGRATLVTLKNVTALYPQLIELAGEFFQVLRDQVAAQTGWDALGNLENAYVPLTTPLDPGLGEDWLYTGRAFTLNPVLVQANWMTVVREDFGQLIYWRIYLHTAAQDGSQGTPLTQVPWDFSARKTSSSAYENGGQLMNSIPSGYWVDLTNLAGQFGWERLPALTNWRTYYAGARFNELVFPQGLDWRTAMLQLYPSDVLVTPTIVIPPTRTPTRTPLWYRSPTPTKTSTARPTSTP
jgi:TolB protein